MRKRASACASAESGTCTAIWSPSKSALNAVQTTDAANGAALNEDRLKRLNAQAVQRRCTVQHDRVVLDDNLQCVPNLALRTLYGLSCSLDVAGGTGLDKALHNKRLKELQCHFLRQAALVHFQLRANNDNGTAGIVNTLTEQVLTEAALLAPSAYRKGT